MVDLPVHSCRFTVNCVIILPERQKNKDFLKFHLFRNNSMKNTNDNDNNNNINNYTIVVKKTREESTILTLRIKRHAIMYCRTAGQSL